MFCVVFPVFPIFSHDMSRPRKRHFDSLPKQAESLVEFDWGAGCPLSVGIQTIFAGTPPLLFGRGFTGFDLIHVLLRPFRGIGGNPPPPTFPGPPRKEKKDQVEKQQRPTERATLQHCERWRSRPMNKNISPLLSHLLLSHSVQ